MVPEPVLWHVHVVQIGWRPLVKAWLAHQLPSCVTQEQRQRLNQLFEWLVDPCIAFVRKHCRQAVLAYRPGCAGSALWCRELCVACVCTQALLLDSA